MNTIQSVLKAVRISGTLVSSVTKMARDVDCRMFLPAATVDDIKAHDFYDAAVPLDLSMVEAMIGAVRGPRYEVYVWTDTKPKYSRSRPIGAK